MAPIKKSVIGISEALLIIDKCTKELNKSNKRIEIRLSNSHLTQKDGKP